MENNYLRQRTKSGKKASPTKVINGDARDLPIDDASVDCIVFDPPYEENVCYAELSDFFYVWLKRTAGYVSPEDFHPLPNGEGSRSDIKPGPVQKPGHQGQVSQETGPGRLPREDGGNFRRMPPGHQARRHYDSDV